MHTVFNISDNGGAVAEKNVYYNCNTYVDNDNIFSDLGGNINTDPEIRNIQLTSIHDAIPIAGSDLINNGASDDDDIPYHDFLNNERDAPDIGAFEYINGPSAPTNLKILL